MTDYTPTPEIAATRTNWMGKLKGLDAGAVMRIHPRKDLSGEKAVKALIAAGWKAGQIYVREHGSTLFIQRGRL